MQLYLPLILTLLVTPVFSLPSKIPSRKRDLITLDLAPNIDVNTLNNVLDDLCVGIATCNPVTVTDASNSKIKRDLITIDLDPSISVDLLNNLLDNLCVGIAVCNPVTVTQTTGSCSE